MRVLLTGGTGLVGGGVLRALLAGGHEVVAPVRSDASAQAVGSAGAQPVRGDLSDRAWLAGRLREVDGAVHTASPGDATSAAFDRGVVEAVAEAFAGTGKPYVHTGGVWVWGSGEGLTEDSPVAPPALTAWRLDVERAAFAVDGARVSVVAPGIVHGGSGGLAGVLSGAPRTESGALRLVGDGTQHWTTVHTDDLGELYVRVLVSGRPGATYMGVSGQSPTVRELGEAASRAAGAGGAVQPETPEETRQRLGADFADALLLDQRASGARARTELGWTPTRPSLVEELAAGGPAPSAG